MTNEDILSKNEKEYEFLNLSYNRFLDLYEEINNVNFMELSPELRFYKIKDIFGVYSELLSYEPIKDFIDELRKHRPPMEAEMSSAVLKYIRNVLVHFPFFKTWNEVYVTKKLINWTCDGKFIDKFLNKYTGHKEVEYRFKYVGHKEFTYVTFSFPEEYTENKIYLKDMISEEDGIRFCVFLMYRVLMSQVISITEK